MALTAIAGTNGAHLVVNRTTSAPFNWLRERRSIAGVCYGRGTQSSASKKVERQGRGHRQLLDVTGHHNFAKSKQPRTSMR